MMTETDGRVAFGYHRLTSRDLDLMAEIIREYSHGHLRPTKATRGRLSEPRHAAVRRWAEREAVLIGRGKTTAGGYGLIYLSSNERIRRGRDILLYTPLRFDVAMDVPVEVLWRLVRPMLPAPGSSIGFSLSAKDGWLDMDICPRGSRWYVEARDRRAMEDILLRLATCGYITYQALGDVWEIRVREPEHDEV